MKPDEQSRGSSAASSERDHLFISYASEDGAFAEWLTLRLTAEGYKVWCDRVKLLGGESYPKDIDAAIKHETFRFLAVLSRASMQKENPLKERTLALNIARARQERFIIPLNLDGLNPTELDWMTSDLTFIPFHAGWAEGLRSLLAVLRKDEAPRPVANGRALVGEWLAHDTSIKEEPEPLWSNALELTEIPKHLLRASVTRGSLRGNFKGVPHYRENDRCLFAFELPASPFPDLKVERIDWKSTPRIGRMETRNMVTNLIWQYTHEYCRAKGLKERQDDDKRHLYFPPGIGSAGRLTFQGYTGRKTWLNVVGERTSKSHGVPEKTRYHLSPSFAPRLDLFPKPVVLLHLRVHLTDLSGTPLSTSKSIRRRKSICKSWWNHEWLSRLLCVLQWLGDGEKEINLAPSGQCRLILSLQPLQLRAPLGIDETRLGSALQGPPYDSEEDD
ncbi:MAG: toll/interleukin-1 receptor domain-containing protein, partial [Acidobacteriota bacterium]